MEAGRDDGQFAPPVPEHLDGHSGIMRKVAGGYQEGASLDLAPLEHLQGQLLPGPVIHHPGSQLTHLLKEQEQE